MKIFLFCIAVFLLQSCFNLDNDTYNESKELVKIDSTFFTVDFSFIPNHIGQFKDLKTDENYIYFSDLTSRKKLMIFKIGGELINDISLEKACGLLNNSVNEIEVLSRDSILLFSTSTNQVAFLNGKGEIQKVINLNDELNWKLDSVKSFELQVSLMNTSSFINRKDLIFYVASYLKKPLSRDEWILSNRQSQWNNGQFVRINNIFSDSVTYEIGGHLNQALSPDDPNAIILENFNYYNVTSSSVYISTLFSDKVFELNPKTMKIEHSYKINSQNSSFGLPVYSSKTPAENSAKVKKLLSKMNKNGLLNRVYYNGSRDHFYIVARIDKDSAISNKWLLIILDNKFEVLNEYLMSLDDWMGILWPTDKGFFIHQKVEPTSYQSQEVKLYEFTY